MPATETFDTPGPIQATIEISIGDLRVTARDRADTVVEVRPSDPSHEPDIRAAEQTRVELTAEGLLIRGPKQRGLPRSLVGPTSSPRRHGSVEVTVGLPAGSRLRADAGVGTLRCAGRLAACEARAGVGDIDVADAGPVDLVTGAGGISVGVASGSATVVTGTGRIRLTEVGGPATVKNGNGETWIGAAAGPLRVRSSNGDITVDQADGDVDAKTSNGALRVGRISRGSTTLRTSAGEIEVGIAAGTAALIDAQTKFGHVRNGLTTADGPASDDEKAEVHAHTPFGDIVIRRAG